MLASIIVSSLAILGRASPIARQDSSSSMLIESARDGKCLAPSSNVLENGTQIISVDCGTAALWDIVQGSGSIILSGTNFAIDLGLQPGNNGPIYLWESFPTAAQQTWFLTGDKRIAQTGGTQCLDEGDDGPQTYECVSWNENQVWNIRQQGDGLPTDPHPSMTFGDPAPLPSVTPTDPPKHTYSVTFADPPAPSESVTFGDPVASVTFADPPAPSESVTFGDPVASVTFADPPAPSESVAFGDPVASVTFGI